MSDDTSSKFLALASAAALVFATVSGGAVTHATFTDAGNVAVTVSVGNVPEDPDPDFAGDGTPTVETTATGTEVEGDEGPASEAERKNGGTPDDSDPHDGEVTDDEAGDDKGTDDEAPTDPTPDDTARETPTNETDGNDTSTNDTSTHDPSVNDGSTTGPSVSDGSTVDRTSARVRSDSTSRRSGHVATVLSVSRTARDDVSGEDQR
ncbi:MULTISPECIES: hypothetical protein [Haloferacaceae]|uniref:Uncharacterized protein n=1 Tax=Halorubrum glutamatedens TaxID=2707018 RepID=A0ABD5QVE0_9EURY|nr:hypothetical protein [Halobellus captivus]